MEYNNQSMIVDGANPSMLWGNIADYLQRLAKSMSKTLNKRQRAGNDITWAELDNINKELHHHLDVIISGNNNVKENRNMNKKLIRLTESDLHRIVKESVNEILNEIGDTHLGSYQLGRVDARARRNGKDDVAKRTANGVKHPVAFLTGYDDQKYHMDAVANWPKYAEGEDERMNSSIEKYRKLDKEPPAKKTFRPYG